MVSDQFELTVTFVNFPLTRPDISFLNFFASAKTNFEFFFKTSFSNSFVLSVKKSPGLLKEQLAKKIVMINSINGLTKLLLMAVVADF